MAQKVISTHYEINVSSGTSGDSSTTGQETRFVFNSKGQVKTFLKKIYRSSTTSYANKFFIARIDCLWDDSTKAVSYTSTQLMASDL